MERGVLSQHPIDAYAHRAEPLAGPLSNNGRFRWVSSNLAMHFEKIITT